MVSPIHERGGTMLGTSRGPVSVEEMAETLVNRNIDILFTIGGDGTLRGAQALAEEIERRGLRISVIGIPKTIDNDLNWTERSFGFRTAVEAARYNIMTAHTEAVCHLKGIGLVKLMGRHSGFIAAHSSLANADVNLCLVPEVPFEMEGKHGLLAALEHRLDLKDHAVIVVAEGAGQEHMTDGRERGHDPSGNVVLKDIGVFLKHRIEEYFLRIGKRVTIKYIDPSYSIRSQPANSLDSELCLTLGQHAVHAGMAGRTKMVLGYWNGNYTHLPIAMAAGRRKQLDPKGRVWQRVLESTGQPAVMTSSAPVHCA
jgi:6-phosphofructokinase 1